MNLTEAFSQRREYVGVNLGIPSHEIEHMIQQLSDAQVHELQQLIQEFEQEKFDSFVQSYRFAATYSWEFLYDFFRSNHDVYNKCLPVIGRMVSQKRAVIRA